MEDNVVCSEIGPGRFRFSEDDIDHEEGQMIVDENGR
jgi:hypothetical protein